MMMDNNGQPLRLNALRQVELERLTYMRHPGMWTNCRGDTFVNRCNYVVNPTVGFETGLQRLLMRAALANQG
jgi:hypothetical protein